MSRLRKLIKKFQFEENNRRRLDLTNGVRLVPERHRLELATVGGAFPLDTDLSARTWLTTPKTLKRWIGFESKHTNIKNSSNDEITSVGFRLSVDGVADLYWDGAAWVAPPDSSTWNTEQEIADNIATFPVATQTIQVVINLQTTDAGVTPHVDFVKFLYESDIEFTPNYMARSLMRELRAQLEPLANFAILADGSGTFVLNPETPYTIDSIDSVYNRTTDPNLLVDLFSSYNSGTNTVTLTGAQTAGDTLLCRFVYKPVVTIMQGQDYKELSKVPAVVLDDIREVESFKIVEQEAVINKASGEGWQLPEGEQHTFEIPIRALTSKELDMQTLSDELSRFVRDNELLTVSGTDEQVRLVLLDGHDSQNFASQVGLHNGRIRVRMVNAVFYRGSAKQVFGTQRMIVQGGPDIVVTP